MRVKQKPRFKIGDRVKATVGKKIYNGIIRDVAFEERPIRDTPFELYWVVFDDNNDELLHTWVNPNRMEIDREEVVFS